MPGTNAGTGQPISFRCSRCRRRHGTREYFGERRTSGRGLVDRVMLTGRKRKAPPGGGGPRNSNYRREYICIDCEHVGWSRHIDLAEK